MSDPKTKPAAPPRPPPRRPKVGLATPDDWDARRREITDVIRQLEEAQRQTKALLARLKGLP